MKVVFDTSILVDHLRNVKQASSLLRKVARKQIDGYISALTEAELFAGRDSANEEKRSLLSELLSLFTKVPINNQIARKAGEFKLRYDVLLDDCVIAATASIGKAKLWTKDLKNFEKIKEIKVEAPY